MLLGTQWYILFNVIAGAIRGARATCARRPAASASAAGSGFRSLYFPASFPYLVTGWVTAAGGAWNASIVAEYVDLTAARSWRPSAWARVISEAADAAPTSRCWRPRAAHVGDRGALQPPGLAAGATSWPRPGTR